MLQPLQEPAEGLSDRFRFTVDGQRDAAECKQVQAVAVTVMSASSSRLDSSPMPRSVKVSLRSVTSRSSGAYKCDRCRGDDLRVKPRDLRAFCGAAEAAGPLVSSGFRVVRWCNGTTENRCAELWFLNGHARGDRASPLRHARAKAAR